MESEEELAKVEVVVADDDDDVVGSVLEYAVCGGVRAFTERPPLILLLVRRESVYLSVCLSVCLRRVI